MGLDMYAIKTRDPFPAPVDFKVPSPSQEELHYWRKHPNLHGWMEDLYRQKGGKDPDFNCVNVALNLNDLDNLEQAVLAEELPETEGFFFGSSCPEDKKGDLAFIRKARQAIKDGYNVYYTSWW